MAKQMKNGLPRKITAEDLYDFKVASGVDISPDGNKVIYSVQRVDRDGEKKYANLWLAYTTEPMKDPFQFTTGNHLDSSPSWSPDGTQIAFLSSRSDNDKPSKLFIIPTTGGEARILADLPGEIGEFVWAPNSKKLVCVVRKKDPEAVEREKDEQKKKLGVVKRHYDRLFYKLDGYGYLPGERWHLWIVDAVSGKTRQITDHHVYDERQPAWSPDSKWLVFVSNRHENPDLNPDYVDLYTIPAAGGEIQKINAPDGPKSYPSVSPDGKRVAYIGSQEINKWYLNDNLWIVPINGSSPAVNLTGNYDLHVDSSTINDLGSTQTMPPVWSLDGKTLYFQTVLHGDTLMKSISVEGDRLETIIPGPGVTASYSFSANRRKLACMFGTMKSPAEAYVKDLETGEFRQLSRVNHELLSQLDLGMVEEVWFTGPDNNELQGWILKPPGFDPGMKYPSILEIHGGPLTQYGSFFMHEFYYLAANGYIVYFSNPRGGRGYGEKHAGAIWGGWGGADYQDLMAWTDYMAEQPYIDPQRMGVTGGSYGGYMTVWIIGHTDRFKAAVTQRCVSNLVSMWGSSDYNWVFQLILGDDTPFENLDKFWQHSPIKYIGKAVTPTKVIHSEMDLRCPIEQGEQVFVALKMLGMDSEMVRFPDEFHGLSRNGRTDRRIARLDHILSWFDKYLKV